MEYELTQLHNALLDVFKNSKEKKIHVSDVFELVKLLVPDLRTGIERRNIKTFLKYVSDVNSVYKFLYPFIIDGRLYVINSNLDPEINYTGFIPTTNITMMYRTDLGQQIRELCITADKLTVMADKLKKCEMRTSKMQNELIMVQSELKSANSDVRKYRIEKANRGVAANFSNYAYTSLVSFCTGVLFSWIYL